MRNNFVKQLHKEMEENKNIFFLTGDLGFNALESLQKSFPDRFINVGIAEANMIGVAAGLALTGKKVIAYSIASFASMRGFEQVRNDICYHNLDVKIIGTGGGYNYGNHGVTHHTVEDVAIMSALPNMKVFSPAYGWEAQEATKAMIKDTGPAYMRLGKNPGIDYSKPSFKFEIGKSYTVRKGGDIAILTTGNIIDYAMEAAALIKKQIGLETTVISFPTLKPVDTKNIIKTAANSKLIAILEEHSIYGGLSAQVALTLALNKQGKNPLFLPLTIPDKYVKSVGSRAFLLKEIGLDPVSVSKKIIAAYKKLT